MLKVRGAYPERAPKGTVSRKKMLSFGFWPNCLPLPQFGQLVQLYSDVDIQDLKASLGLKILFIKQV